MSIFNTGSQSFSEALNQKEKLNNDKSFFNYINFFRISNGAKSIYLTSDNLEIDSKANLISFVNPIGKFYDLEGKPTSYQSKQGQFNQRKNVLHLKKSVKVFTSDYYLESEKLIYHTVGDLVDASVNVRTKSHLKTNGDFVYLSARKLIAHPEAGTFKYNGNVKGQIKKKRAYEDDIFIKSQVLSFDSNNNVIFLNDMVEVKKEFVTATAEKGEIYLDNYNKSLKYFLLNDDVLVKESFQLPDGTTIDRKAVSEQLEGIVSEDKYILTGYPKVFQDKDILKGNKIVLRENNEIIEVDNANTSFILK
ncbi:MAG: LPS export ABC transporter periplasmic protein LptC [Bdellovibrionales bacterium]|jgi:lipopolysaccharide export system protein LptA|nr:LPS export ABC transporter periplasmic protein LptC [Bdellovibrionales bacterium]